MHYLITGHTGFKGSWLTLWLTSQGHTVSGLSLDPISGSLYEKARIHELVKNDIRLDIRDSDGTIKAIQDISPDVVFHLAAQPLVRESYKDPRGTLETNVLGTLNVLEGVSGTKSVKAHLVITTDKVYRNINQVEGYVESDSLGGEDPYSASKAMADILAHSWVSSFGGPPTAIVRAGNVIGGGDVSPDRLIPDLISKFERGESPILRYPNSVRPWQHVLDCLNGYLKISDALLAGKSIGEINIGPNKKNFMSVADVADVVATHFPNSKPWVLDSSSKPHEEVLLTLNTSKAEELLSWSDKLSFQEMIYWTTDWYSRVKLGLTQREVSLSQIDEFRKIN